MKTQAVLCLLALEWALAAACTSQNPPAVCQRFCQLASTCGLLPSALGLDVGNCASRCGLTDGPTSDALTKCETQAAPDADPGGLWCGSSGVIPVCAAFSRCLETTYPGTNLTGEAILDLRFVATPPVDPAAVIRSASDEACASDATQPSATPDCETIGIRALTVFVEQTSERLVASMTCSVASLQPLTISGLQPGAVRPIVEVQADLGSGGSPQCRRFYGPRAVLVAAKHAPAVVPVPMTSELFAAGAACVPAS
jgi:hypothetical protein